MSTFSKAERKEIAQALRACLKHLWEGFDNDEDKEEFICHALSKAFHPGYWKARDVIMERLGYTNNVESWLIERGFNKPELPDWTVRVQAYRKAWVKELIKEFSK